MQPYLRPEGQQLRQGYADVPVAASHEANPLALLLAIAADPRNSWIGGPGKIVHGAESLPALIAGLGPLFKSGRGWEVLKEYIEKGGTPKTLRDLLRKRGYHEADTSRISEGVRQGTDVAAPSARPGMTISPAEATAANERGAFLRERYPEEILAKQRFGYRRIFPLDQQLALQNAEDVMKKATTDPIDSVWPRTAGESSQFRAQRAEAAPSGHVGEHEIPSGTQGQAAYQAIASRMARLMDDPNFLSLRQHYLPPPVSDKAYYAEHPIHRGGSMHESLFGGAGAPSQHELYGEAPEYPNRISNPAWDRLQQQRAAPRTFSAAENQRTSNLNRRADQRQNPPEEP